MANIILLDPNEVTCIVAEDDYAVVKCGAREILSDETLDALASRLDRSRFMRVHRSSICNLAHAVRLERDGDRKYVLILQNGARLAISRERLDDVRSALGIA